MEKVILYGAGKDGIAALDLIGRENVLCFCDNKKYTQGEVEGIKVISFDCLRQYKDEIIVITETTIRSVYEITRQLVENVFNFTLMDDYMEK